MLHISLERREETKRNNYWDDCIHELHSRDEGGIKLKDNLLLSFVTVLNWDLWHLQIPFEPLSSTLHGIDHASYIVGAAGRNQAQQLLRWLHSRAAFTRWRWHKLKRYSLAVPCNCTLFRPIVSGDLIWAIVVNVARHRSCFIHRWSGGEKSSATITEMTAFTSCTHETKKVAQP